MLFAAPVGDLRGGESHVTTLVQVNPRVARDRAAACVRDPSAGKRRRGLPLRDASAGPWPSGRDRGRRRGDIYAATFEFPPAPNKIHAFGPNGKLKFSISIDFSPL